MQHTNKQTNKQTKHNTSIRLHTYILTPRRMSYNMLIAAVCMFAY